jgi:hypothetical protein
MIRTAFILNPNGWLMMTAGELTIALATTDDSPMLPELWSLLESKGDAGAALDVLTRSGISAAPEFVIVGLGVNAKVLVRGPATVTVAGSDEQVVSGAGFSSWAERSFDRVDSYTCQIGAGASTTSAALPLLSGAVRTNSFAGNVAGVVVFAAGEVVSSSRAAAVTASVLVSKTPIAPIPEPATVASQPITPALIPPAPIPLDPIAEATVVAVDDEEPVDEPQPREISAAKPSPYDDLFGETSYRTVEGAAVRPSDDGDDTRGIEDRTVVAGDLAQLRAERRARRGRSVEVAPTIATYFIELSTGGRELLDQTLVVGRAPSATALGGGNIPRLVTMITPNQDISRTHAKFTVEGGAVVVTDLHSRNGTIVTLPGRPSQKLREGEPTVVIPGTIVDLGDGATLTVRKS